MLFKSFLLAIFILNIDARDRQKTRSVSSEKEKITAEVENMIDDFALLKQENNLNSNRAKYYKNNIAAPFIWPVNEKDIKSVSMVSTNIINFELKTDCEVLNPHTGIVISVNKKVVAIKHIVEGGTCYISILKNIDNINVKEGDIIETKKILGTSSMMVFELKQMDVKIRPSLDMLFPPLNSKLIKVVKYI